MGYADYNEEMFPYLGEEYEIVQAKDNLKLMKSIYKKELKKVTDEKLLNKIVHEKRNKHVINNIVPNKKFPAYTIAAKLKESGNPLSEKQRTALINVFAHYLAS